MVVIAIVKKKKCRIKAWRQTSLVVQRLGLCADNAGPRAQSLVGELRSYMLCAMAKRFFFNFCFKKSMENIGGRGNGVVLKREIRKKNCLKKILE